MVLFGDEHSLQRIQCTLLFFVRDEDATLLAVEGAVDAGHSAELGEDVPDVALRQALVVDERDRVVAEFVGLEKDYLTSQIQRP